MKSEQFNQIIEERLEKCKKVLCGKAEEYASAFDRLHNFKVAAELQGITPMTALAGMMAKHTVSVYDLINGAEIGNEIPPEMWDEKIGDHINYLLLLTALVAEKRESECQIRVLIKDPGEPPRSTYIINTLENLQETVGGYIETVTLTEDLVIICNEEGRLKGLPYNCNICGIDFVGTIIFAGIKGDKFSDLPAGHNTIK